MAPSRATSLPPPSSHPHPHLPHHPRFALSPSSTATLVPSALNGGGATQGINWFVFYIDGATMKVRNSKLA